MNTLRFLVMACCMFYLHAIQAGGFLVVMPDQHQRPNPQLPANTALFPLENRSLQVETKIIDQTAITSIDQVFFNPTGRQLEAYFLFPIPKDVVINKFSMFINGKEMQAEMLDATKAREIYEAIVRRSQDPALLEYYNQGLFRVRIFPILPNSEQRIKLTYTENLAKDNGTVSYTFPLNTQKFSSKPLQNVSMRVQVESTDALKTLYCPTYQTEIIRKDDQHASVGFEQKNIRPDRDFELYFNTAKSKVGFSLLTYNDNQEDGYFFLNLSPGFGEKEEVVAKDIVFVFDKSGSMSDEKMEQGKKALLFCLSNLNKGDRFEIVPFSTEAQTLFGEVKEYTPETHQRAKDFIKGLSPIGGTNIDEAFQLALGAQKSNQQRPFFVVFMTDGKPTIGETNEDALLKKIQQHNKGNVRVFTFGIGTDINTHLLDKITESTKAYRTYVLPDEDIEVKVSDFYTKVASPVLTDIKVSFDKNVHISDVYHKQIPDLFKGSTVSLMGRYKGAGKAKITLTGKVNGKEETFEYEIELEKRSTKHDFIPSLWASRAVGYLLDQIRLHGENKELVDEVVRLAKKHGIITPYTSYLILEDEARLVTNNRIRASDQVLAPRAKAAPDLVREVQLEEDMVMDKKEGNKSGKGSVRASSELQRQSNTTNVADLKVGSERLQYKDANTGVSKNLGDDISHVNGRALYNNNNQWVDADIQLKANKNTKTNRIEFNSREYYTLLQNEDAAAVLALGSNVRFMLNGEIYEVYVN